jgi:hypothetical protein
VYLCACVVHAPRRIFMQWQSGMAGLAIFFLISEPPWQSVLLTLLYESELHANCDLSCCSFVWSNLDRHATDGVGSEESTIGDCGGNGTVESSVEEELLSGSACTKSKLWQIWNDVVEDLNGPPGAGCEICSCERNYVRVCA